MCTEITKILLRFTLGASVMLGSSSFAGTQSPVLTSKEANFKTSKINRPTATSILASPRIAVSQKSRAQAFGGKIGSGGGNSIIQVDKNEFIKKMKSEYIKDILGEYLATLSFNEFKDRESMVFPDNINRSLSLIDRFFKDNYKTSNRLVPEILQSPFTFGDCENEKGEPTEASTAIGKLGSSICFNLELIYSGIKTNFDEVEVEVKLSALLLHEAVHHLQSSHDTFEKNESVANVIGQYFQTFMIQSLRRLSGVPYQLNRYRFLGSKPPSKVINSPNSISFVYLNEPQELPRNYSNGKELLDAITDIRSTNNGTFQKLKRELQKDCQMDRECFAFSNPILVARDPSEDIFVWMIIVYFVDWATGHETIPKYQVFIKDSVEITPNENADDDNRLMDVLKKVELYKVRKFEI